MFLLVNCLLPFPSVKKEKEKKEEKHGIISEIKCHANIIFVAAFSTLRLNTTLNLFVLNLWPPVKSRSGLMKNFGEMKAK